MTTHNTKSRTRVLTSVPTQTKLLLVSVMAIAFGGMMLALAPGALNMGNDQSLQLNKPPRIGSRPTPLVVRTLTDARVNVPIETAYTRVNFFSEYSDPNTHTNGILGNLDLHVNGFIAQTSDIVGHGPLAVNFSINPTLESDSVSFDSRIIYLSVSPTEKYTLCLPPTVVPTHDTSQAQPVYYYDTDGTPYQDAVLTQKLLPQPCNQMLSKGLFLASVPFARANVSVDSTQFPIVDFIRSYSSSAGEPMGMLDLRMNNYLELQATQELPAGPLAIRLSLDATNATAETLPSRVIYINDAQNRYYYLCLPETEAVAGIESTLVDYYYDKNGTPYNDSLLTQPALSEPCNQMLARAMRINSVNTASVNTLLSFPEAYALLNRDFISGWDSSGWDDYGHISLHTGYFTWGGSGGATENVLGGPFSVSLVNYSTDQPATFDARILLVRTNQGQVYHVCLPSTVVTPLRQPAYYFYDKNGTAYTDSLLLHRAMAQDCNAILAKALKVNSIALASIKTPLETPDLAWISFMTSHPVLSGSSELGRLDLNLNNYIREYPDAAVTEGPLAVRLWTMFTSGVQTFAAGSIKITIPGTTDQSYILCLPQTTLPSDSMNAPVNYFYDVNGRPYSDSFLSNPVACQQTDTNLTPRAE